MMVIFGVMVILGVMKETAERDVKSTETGTMLYHFQLDAALLQECDHLY